MELLNAVKEFTDDEEKEDKSLGAFLQEVALITGLDNEDDSNEEKVTLMTIHMAKGLEFGARLYRGDGRGLVPFADDAEQPRRP